MLKFATPMCRARPLPLGLGQRRHGLGERDLRIGPVHQQQIDVVDLKRGEALVDRFGEGVGAQIFVATLWW